MQSLQPTVMNQSVGTLDVNKRPDLLLDVAAACATGRYSFAIVGGGPLLESVRERIDRERLSDVRASLGRLEGT